MRTYLGLLTNAVRSALRSKHDLMLEDLALRQQLAVLTRQRARTRTKPADRLFWSWLSRYWPGWRSPLVIVQPETVVRGHRTAWRGYWTWKSRARQPGRPRISKELQGLIARIATENPRWGTVRIQGELLALGYLARTNALRCPSVCSVTGAANVRRTACSTGPIPFFLGSGEVCHAVTGASLHRQFLMWFQQPVDRPHVGDPEGDRDLVVPQPCRAQVRSRGAQQRAPRCIGKA